ncbi:hypothetical protein [Lewinella sp. W8]|uniref:hypothetical protein n=1 Tax=Lewinella sp. W8 TaxID=2528208 RepID=UPI001068B290|nr:hypothetical protein [Lewinella sp. W8]MTB50646.1 hypothetical protein [Lewinella sp. W8]
MKTYTSYFLSLAFLLILFAPSCAPVFSDLQSARTVGQGNHELTPSYSSVSASNDGETQGVQNHLGLQYALGLSDKVDLRLRYEYIWAKGDDSFENGVHVLAAGPKFSLVKDRVAFFLPVGKPFGEDVEDAPWQIHPTVLLTAPLVPQKFDLTLGTKYIIVLEEGVDGLLAFNLGAAISSDVTKWAIRPEYGRLYNPGEMGSFGQFSIGFTKAFGQGSKK